MALAHAPVTAKDIIARACGTPDGRDALLAFCPAVGGREPTSKSLGRRLRAVVGRRVAGRWLAEVGKDRTKTVLWKVETSAKGKETLQTLQTRNYTDE